MTRYIQDADIMLSSERPPVKTPFDLGCAKRDGGLSLDPALPTCHRGGFP